MIMKLSNVRKKIRESSNVTKKLLNVMVELHNMRIKPSNVRKKEEVKKPLNVRKELLHVMLILYKLRMKLSNVRKK